MTLEQAIADARRRTGEQAKCGRLFCCVCGEHDLRGGRIGVFIPNDDPRPWGYGVCATCWAGDRDLVARRAEERINAARGPS